MGRGQDLLVMVMLLLLVVVVLLVSLVLLLLWGSQRGHDLLVAAWNYSWPVRQRGERLCGRWW